jgi:hypothetical protein
MPYVTGPSLSIQAFWKSIDDAWEEVDGGAAVAALMEILPPRNSAAARIMELLPEFITALESIMAKYTTTQLHAWDEHLDVAVNDLARAGAHPRRRFIDPALDTGNYLACLALSTSKDGEDFLHARAFVVALGAKFGEGFYKHPETHSLRWSYAPEMIGLGRKVYDKRKEAADKPETEANNKPETEANNQPEAEANNQPEAGGFAEESETPTDTPLVTPIKSVVTESTADDSFKTASDTLEGNEPNEVEDDDSGW